MFRKVKHREPQWRISPVARFFERGETRSVRVEWVPPVIWVVAAATPVVFPELYFID